MATSTGEVEKINVRSPFYLTIDSESAPPAYTPPAILTQPLGCGGQINIGEDVGTRIYEVDVTNRSGSFTINFTINIPIKITYQLTEDSSPTVVGYKGNNEYEQELIDMGISSSELTGLSSGIAQGGIPVTRSTDSASTLTITIEAPMATDDYQLIMSCPAETAAPETSFSLPSTPPTNTDLLSGSATLAMAFHNRLSGTLPVSPSMKIYVNDSLITTLSPAAFGFDDNTNTPTIIFSSVSGLNWASAVQSYDKSPVIVSDSAFISGDNKIGISLEWTVTSWNTQIDVGLIEFIRTGVFRNTTANEYQFAYYEYQGTFGYYGGTNIYDTEVKMIGVDRNLFTSGIIYTFNYNTTTKTVSRTTDNNILTVSQADLASGGVKV